MGESDGSPGNRRRPNSLKTALEYFNQAIEEDLNVSGAIVSGLLAAGRWCASRVRIARKQT